MSNKFDDGHPNEEPPSPRTEPQRWYRALERKRDDILPRLRKIRVIAFFSLPGSPLSERAIQFEFANLVLNATDDDNFFLPRVKFTNEANFDMNGHVYRSKWCIWAQ